MQYKSPGDKCRDADQSVSMLRLCSSIVELLLSTSIKNPGLKTGAKQ